MQMQLVFYYFWQPLLSLFIVDAFDGGQGVGRPSKCIKTWTHDPVQYSMSIDPEPRPVSAAYFRALWK